MRRFCDFLTRAEPMRLLVLAVLSAALAPLGAQGVPASAPPPRADLIVTGARIYTVDDNHPVVSALAVRAGRVQFVGSAREALALRGPNTRVVDASGRTIVPGI